MIHKRTRLRAAPATLGPRAEPIEARLLFSAYVAGSATAYATIQAAVNAAPVGGTVTVDAGTYAEQVTVSQSLTIDGAEAGMDASTGARITATPSTETYVTGATVNGVVSSAFHILASDVTIDGFTVTGETNQDDALGAGIVIGPNFSGTHILNNVIRNNVSGLFLANDSPTDAAVIRQDYFGSNNNAGDNGGRGIYTDGTISGGNLTNVTIDSDTFAYNRGGSGTTGLEAGIAFEAGNPGEQSNLRITNSTFTDDGKAALFFNSTNVVFENNTVTGTLDQYSGSVRFEGNNNTVSILDNNIHDNYGPGVAVDSSGTPGDSSGFVANGNDLENNNSAYAELCAIAVNFSEYDGSFDARNNWYGDASGPSGEGPGIGDAVSNGVKLGSGWSFTTGGDFVYSPWATSPVTVPATAPTAPSGLTATAASASEIDLTWKASSGQTAYAVDRSTDGGNTFTTIATPTATTYSDTGLTASTTYTYRVRATNAVGTSAASNVVSATTAEVVPTTPSALTATAASSTVINLSWTASTVQSAYAVDRSTDGGNTFTTIATPTATTYSDIGLAASTTYTYRVRATNAVGTSAASNVVSATTAGVVPTAPSALTATAASSTVINLSWIASTGQSAYAVDRSTDGGNTFTTIATPTATTYSDTGLTASTTYTYRVRATNTVGTSAASNVVSATTAAATSTTITLTGTVIGTAGSYKGDGNTIANAFDGNLNTFYDGAAATGDWAGLDLGTAKSIVQIAFAPRSGFASRMVGGIFQSSPSATFASGVVNLYTVAGAPAVGKLTIVSVAASAAQRYVRYLSPASSSGNVAEIVFYASSTTAVMPTARTGTVIGTAGSYKGAGNTIANAVDGNLTTFFDGPMANGCWVGLDLGSAESVSQISYAPRGGFASRMIGGAFQFSTTADFSSGVTTLFTITTAPPGGVLTTVKLASAVTARYFRYLSPNGSEGDVAEIAFAG